MQASLYFDCDGNIARSICGPLAYQKRAARGRPSLRTSGHRRFSDSRPCISFLPCNRHRPPTCVRLCSYLGGILPCNRGPYCRAPATFTVAATFTIAAATVHDLRSRPDLRSDLRTRDLRNRHDRHANGHCRFRPSTDQRAPGRSASWLHKLQSVRIRIAILHRCATQTSIH